MYSKCLFIRLDRTISSSRLLPLDSDRINLTVIERDTRDKGEIN